MSQPETSVRGPLADRIEQAGIELPAPFPPAGSYVNAVRAGDLVWTAGHIPIAADGSIVFGRLGESLSVEEGVQAARYAAGSVLASLQAELGDLDLVQRVVRVYGVVNSTPDFVQHTQVIDGASDVLIAVFGEQGRHARLAVGVASLPAGIALEIEATVLVRPVVAS
ncbi:MAG TPA: RidA family protein [Acidimicrobiales bacterium]|jgi:enamine deaminase RidA (YjgF/YER057c/UK114 family)